MDIKVLLCNCKGLCPSFKGADMNTLPFEVESELDVTYAVLHPQFCGQGGNAVLMDVMSKASPDTYILRYQRRHSRKMYKLATWSTPRTRRPLRQRETDPLLRDNASNSA